MSPEGRQGINVGDRASRWAAGCRHTVQKGGIQVVGCQGRLESRENLGVGAIPPRASGLQLTPGRGALRAARPSWRAARAVGAAQVIGLGRQPAATLTVSLEIVCDSVNATPDGQRALPTTLEFT